MGRKANADRGIYARKLSSGKLKWYIRFAWQGQDIRRSGGDTKEQARRKLRALLTDLQRGTIELDARKRDTVAGAMARYLPFAARQRNFQKAKGIRTWWMNRLGDLPLTSLTPAIIHKAQIDLINSQRAPATVNRYTDWLRHLLNREVRLGHLASNPVRRITRLHEPEAPVHQYSDEQEEALIRELGDDGAFVRLAILTGLRQSEQFGLRKEWIQWQDGIIQLPTSKAQRPRIVVLSQESLELVVMLAARHPASPYLFPSPLDPDKPRDPRAWYRRVFRPACQRVGLPNTLKWHTLRHTFGSRLAALGANAHHIQALGGWSTSRAANRYIHLQPHDLRAIAEQLSTAKPAHATGTRPSDET